MDKHQTTELCRFVPGETYNNRSGSEYRFVAVDQFAGKAIFYCKGTAAYVLRNLDGRVYPGGTLMDDIIPPKRTLVRWAFVYMRTYSKKEPIFISYATQDAVEQSFRWMSATPNFVLIKPVFKLEVDLD